MLAQLSLDWSSQLFSIRDIVTVGYATLLQNKRSLLRYACISGKLFFIIFRLSIGTKQVKGKLLALTKLEMDPLLIVLLQTINKVLAKLGGHCELPDCSSNCILKSPLPIDRARDYDSSRKGL